MFPPKVPSSDVTWGSIGGPLRRGPLYHDGSLASEENHLKGTLMFQNGDGVQIACFFWTNALIRVRYFLRGAVTSKQVEDVDKMWVQQMEMRQILMWSPQCVCTKKHKKDKHGPKMGTSLEFRTFKSSWKPRRYSWILYLGSNPLCLISPHFLPHLSSPNSRQFDEGNAQKRQDAEYETRLEKETHEILLSQLK